MDETSGSWIPKKISKYDILSKLGHGSMGIVYKGFDPLIQREVALKTIRKDFLKDQDMDLKSALYRFRMEAQASGRLNHPNIVSIYEFDEDDETFFIAMEIVTGRELKDYFSKNERFMDMAEITDILYQLLDALSHSHERGVIHRDIKPANIIIMKNHQIKVADFGIASVESSEYTQIGSILGTPGYMSPEQIQGEKVDARSDLFSVGVIFYQFLTGKKPFGGTTFPTLMHKILNSDPIPPSQLNESIPAALDDVVMKALAKKPVDRFQSATEFSSAIKHAMDDQGRSEYTSSPNAIDEQPLNTFPDDATVMISDIRPQEKSIPAKSAPMVFNSLPQGPRHTEEANSVFTSTVELTSNGEAGPCQVASKDESQHSPSPATPHSKRFLFIALVFLGLLAVGAIVLLKSDSFFNKVPPIIQKNVTAPRQDGKGENGPDQRMKPMMKNKPEDGSQADMAAGIPEKAKTKPSLKKSEAVAPPEKTEPKKTVPKPQVTVIPGKAKSKKNMPKPQAAATPEKAKPKKPVAKTQAAVSPEKAKLSISKPGTPAHQEKAPTAIKEVETTDVLKFIEALQRQAEQ